MLETLYLKSKNKILFINLQNIYGINSKTSLNICNNLGLNPYTAISNLTTIEIQKINYYIEQNYKVNINLKYQIELNIKKLILLKNYKGKRHNFNLPVRGQRTRDNAKTAKKLNKLKS